MTLHLLTRISQVLMGLGLLGLFCTLPFMVAPAFHGNINQYRLFSLCLVIAGFILAFAVEAYWKKHYCKVA